MFDNKQTNQNPPNNQTQGSSIDEDLQNTGPTVDLENLNKDKEFPFKKAGSAPASLQEPTTEDIFSNTEKKENSEVVKPMTSNNQQQAPVGNTPLQGKKSEVENDNLPPEVNLVQKTGKKSNVILTVIIICLAVVLLSLAGFWVYSKYINNEDETFEEFGLEEEEENFNDMLKGFSDTLNEQPAPEPEPEEPDDFFEDEEDDIVEPLSDLDKDGLTDEEEILLGINPNRVDTDFDGLSDYDEVKIYFTDPIDVDSDKDGYLDGVEVDKGYNPIGPGRLNPDEENLGVDWGTFKNSDYDYEIKYPNDLLVDEANLEKLNIVSLTMAYIAVRIYPTEENVNFRNFVKAKLMESFGNILDMDTVKWTEENNIISVEFENMIGGYTGDVVWTYILKDNKVYRISAYHGHGNMTQPEFQEQIISNFKFLD